MSKEASKPLRRELTPEIRVLSESEGLVEYVASDQTLDSYKEIILADGWKFDERFEKNPVFLDSHSYWGIRDLIGRVTDWRVENGQLIEVVKWAIDVESNALAKLGFDMTQKGYLKAVSVGFNAVRSVHRSDDEFTEVVESINLAGEARDSVRRIFVEQQQIELSACVIGANPSALAKGAHSGDIREELLVNCGIDEAALEAVELAGRIVDNTKSDDERDFARLNLSSFLRSQRNLSGHPGGSRSATSPPESGSAGEEQRNRSRDISTENLKKIAASLGI